MTDPSNGSDAFENPTWVKRKEAKAARNNFFIYTKLRGKLAMYYLKDYTNDRSNELTDPIETENVLGLLLNL